MKMPSRKWSKVFIYTNTDHVHQINKFLSCQKVEIEENLIYNARYSLSHIFKQTTIYCCEDNFDDYGSHLHEPVLILFLYEICKSMQTLKCVKLKHK